MVSLAQVNEFARFTYLAGPVAGRPRVVNNQAEPSLALRLGLSLMPHLIDGVLGELSLQALDDLAEA